MSGERSKPSRSRDEEKRESDRKARLRAESQDADLTAALDDSFPASDPPSMTAPKGRVGAPKRRSHTAEK
ncbi:MAG TPA: hypothetical protein VG271_01260 [Beijerinckiaceae bacterium]|jgi:hypothetical protein|nr:hypothetical protein [Beijerinckiaceae bacterium]